MWSGWLRVPSGTHVREGLKGESGKKRGGCRKGTRVNEGATEGLLWKGSTSGGRKEEEE